MAAGQQALQDGYALASRLEVGWRSLNGLFDWLTEARLRLCPPAASTLPAIHQPDVPLKYPHATAAHRIISTCFQAAPSRQRCQLGPSDGLAGAPDVTHRVLECQRVHRRSLGVAYLETKTLRL